MRALLLELEAVLRDLYLICRGKTRILFFSDHGNTLALSQPVPLKSFLAARGYRLTDSLRRDRDVAVPSYGLVGFAAVYCQETQVARLAEELVHLPGADLVIHGRGDSVTVLNRQGMAQLDWSADGERFRYRALTADPIALLPALEKLGQHIAVGSVAPEGWVRREDLLQVTADSRYPDAPARLRGWAINHVVHRASIMVSLADGYYYGSGLFQRIVTLRSTHGSLTATSSTGFAMTTDGTLPDPSPVEEVVPLSATRRKQFAK
jgi:hypothetical protein